MLSLKDLERDLKILPYEALKAIQSACLKELGLRRKDQVTQAHKLSQLFPGVPHSGPPSSHLATYTENLLSQDWSSFFPGEADDKRFYVYAHVRPGKSRLKIASPRCNLIFNGTPFYIGKGTGDRAYDLKRNQGHGVHIREVMERGFGPSDICHIVKDGLTEAEALELESKLVYLLGTRYEIGRKGILVNLDIPPRPDFIQWKRWKKIQGAIQHQAMERT